MSSYSKYEVTFWDNVDQMEFPVWVHAHSEEEAIQKAKDKGYVYYEFLYVEEVGFPLPV